VVESVPAAIAGPAPAPPLWLTLADRGEYQRAYHGLEEHGGFDAVLLNASADELMVLVDVARATSNRGRAIQALRRVTQSFVSDPNAPIAAMTLGRMLMQAGDRKGASEAFSLYRRLSPQGDFAEDALASDIQAAVEERNWERARTLAKQYEADFPDGRHLEQIREQLNTAQQTAGPDAEASVDDQSAEVDSVALPPPLDSPY
jgi:predicted Zn-dependent protease